MRLHTGSGHLACCSSHALAASLPSHLSSAANEARELLSMRPSTRPLAQIVNAERIVVLGWGRAILAQLAHPLVAAGVADHSTFARDTWSAFRRFQTTVRAMRAFTFGPPEAAREAARRIARKHDQVQGMLREPSLDFRPVLVTRLTIPNCLPGFM